MRYLVGIAALLAASLAAQAPAAEDDKDRSGQEQAIQQVEQENDQAGRVPFTDADCD